MLSLLTSLDFLWFAKSPKMIGGQSLTFFKHSDINLSNLIPIFLVDENLDIGYDNCVGDDDNDDCIKL